MANKILLKLKMKPKIILLGGGGHCVSCIDVIEQQNNFEIAGIVEIEGAGGSLLNYPIIGGDKDISKLRLYYKYAFVTVGQIKNSETRMRLFLTAKLLGFQFPVIISPRAYVSGRASVGEGTIIMHDAFVNARALVGCNSIINSKAIVEHDAVVEDNCHISTAAVVNGGAIIRQGTFIGSNAVTKEGVQTRENDFIKAGDLFKGHA